MALYEPSPLRKEAAKKKDTAIQRLLQMMERNQAAYNQQAQEARQLEMREQREAGELAASREKFMAPDVMQGASIGSTFGPWGALVGAGIGHVKGGIRGIAGAEKRGENVEEAFGRAALGPIGDIWTVAENPKVLETLDPRQAAEAVGNVAQSIEGERRRQDLQDLLKAETAAGEGPEAMAGRLRRLAQRKERGKKWMADLPPISARETVPQLAGGYWPSQATEELREEERQESEAAKWRPLKPEKKKK